MSTDPPPTEPVRPEILRQLAEVLRRAERTAGVAGGGVDTPHSSLVTSGVPAVDRLLPSGGFVRGTLVEWLAPPNVCGPGAAGGAGALALSAAREAALAGGAVVVVERADGDALRFHPPAAAAWGVDLARLLIVRPTSDADEIWALDQVARCRGVAAWLWWGGGLEGRDFRRLQLATEQSGSLGLLVRPCALQSQPSWATLRMVVEPLPAAHTAGTNDEPRQTVQRLRVRLLRVRGGADAATVDLEIDDATYTIAAAKRGDLAASLADSASLARRAGA